MTPWISERTYLVLKLSNFDSILLRQVKHLSIIKPEEPLRQNNIPDKRLDKGVNNGVIPLISPYGRTDNTPFFKYSEMLRNDRLRLTETCPQFCYTRLIFLYGTENL